MALRSESMRLPLPREHETATMQLPGVHELLSAAPRTFPPPSPSARIPPALDSQPRSPFSGPPPTAPLAYRQPAHYTDAARPSTSPTSHPLPPPLQTRHSYLPSPYATPVAYDPRSAYAGPSNAPPRPDTIRRDSARPVHGSKHPLPHEIRQQLIPGRGPCWVYNDGSICPVSIDGELVNPMWGTTKAGKARKRLAQACLSCREKKIRCEPQFPRCAQCEKANRECTMPSQQLAPEEDGQPQTVMQFTTSPPTEPSRPLSARPYKRRRSNDGSALTPPSEPDQRAYDSAREPASYFTPRHDATLNPSTPKITTVTPKQTEGAVIGWHIDPYEEDPETTLHLLNVVFMPSMTVFNHMLPRALFRRWVVENKAKRPEETMVLYSMLALGYSMSKDHSSFGQTCLHRATTAMEKTVGRWSFMLGQARLNMAHVAFAHGQTDVASDYVAAAVQAIRMAGLLTEDGCLEQDRLPQETFFGMNAHQVAEAKRRTLWAAYILEQLHMEHTPVLSTLPEGHIRLRHPCTDDIYEGGLPSRASFFESSLRASISHSLPDQTTTNPLAFVTEIAHLIGSQHAFAAFRLDRTNLGDPGIFAQEYTDFVHVMEQRLSAWLAAIPSSLRMTDASFRVPTDEHNLALSMSVTALYHVAIIHATRFTKHASIPRQMVAENIRRADQSAQDILHLADSLCSFGQNLPEGQILHHVIPPFLSYAISLAVDTLCAGGSRQNLRRTLSQAMAGCTILDSLAYVWPRAYGDHASIERRVSDLQELERGAGDAVPGIRICKGGAGWRCVGPLLKLRKKPQRLDSDAVYGVDDEEYFGAVQR